MDDLGKLASLGINVVADPNAAEQPQEQQEEVKQESSLTTTVESNDGGEKPQTSTTKETSDSVKPSEPHQSKEVAATSEQTSQQEDNFGEIVDLGEGDNNASDEQSQSFDLLSAFNEKYQTQFESEDDIRELLKPRETPELSEAAKKIDAWTKTGKPLSEWFKTQIDYTKVPDKNLVVQSLTEESGLSTEEAQAIFEDEYSRVEIDEDVMDEKEIAAAKRRNAAVDAKVKQKANAYRAKMEKIKEEYGFELDKVTQQQQSEKQVDEGLTKEEREAWNKEMSYTLQEFENMQIDLGNGKAFKFSTKDYIDTNRNTLTDPDTAFSEFLKEDGSGFDTKRVAKALILENNFDKIAKSIYTHAFGQGAKTTIDSGKNLKYNVEGQKAGNQDTSRDELEKNALETIHRIMGGGKMSLKL